MLSCLFTERSWAWAIGRWAGDQVVKALDSHGTRSGRPTAEAKIMDCGCAAARCVAAVKESFLRVIYHQLIFYLTHILTFIVDLPINSMVIFHSSCLPEAIWHSI